MTSLVFPVAVIGSIATLVMMIAMLYLVWISMGDETHAPGIVDDDDRPEIEGNDRDGDRPEVAESETA